MPFDLHGKVAFASGKTGDYDVWTLDLDDGAYTQITQGAAWNDKPNWSPDGQWIVFVSNATGVSELWKAPAGGGEAVQLTFSGKWCDCPRFSPDGSSIAYISNVAGSNDVWVMDADGRNPRQVTTHGGNDNFVCWTPDGTGLIWSSDRDLGDADLWKIDLAGGEKEQITGAFGADFAPRVSPDGRFVAFTSNRPLEANPKDLREDRDKDIYLQELASGFAVRLTDCQGSDDAPCWSPDGQAILYAASGDKTSSRLRVLWAQDVIDAYGTGDEATIERVAGNIRRESLEIDREPLKQEINAVRHTTFVTAWLPNRLLESVYPPNYFGSERNPDWLWGVHSDNLASERAGSQWTQE